MSSKHAYRPRLIKADGMLCCMGHREVKALPATRRRFPRRPTFPNPSAVPPADSLPSSSTTTSNTDGRRQTRQRVKGNRRDNSGDAEHSGDPNAVRLVQVKRAKPVSKVRPPFFPQRYDVNAQIPGGYRDAAGAAKEVVANGKERATIRSHDMQDVSAGQNYRLTLNLVGTGDSNTGLTGQYQVIVKDRPWSVLSDWTIPFFHPINPVEKERGGWSSSY